ncbi:HD domain-containing protein [Salinarimonas soli]|uniref:HD domain-containing protein n=1 Tax=Salinarimonas soli TaxID=1638099 RepID=A0A5B2VRC4_9HYPH|nr:HD domain-containing protein [Salinarimonas soli]KAA2242333.1 HD domain-containing protein [Salinarimonas soli]
MGASPGLVPLLKELGDLKRIRSAGAPGSIAERRFRAAWGALVAGADPAVVMEATNAACLAAARLGDLDGPTLRLLGLTFEESVSVLEGALAEVSAPLSSPGGRGEALIARLRAALARELPVGAPPPFVEALARQPRAGVTCPGKSRIMLEPPENHAEHCLMVAVYGVILSPFYDADPETVFLVGLAHHLHNAAMPDSGFTGEMLLGDHLEPVMARATARALDELPPALRATVERARAILPDADTPEGRAFHAADVADRVLQIAQHLAAASLTMDVVLDDMELVHDGPVKAFHDGVLRELGLA